MNLNELSDNPGARKARTRVGRGFRPSITRVRIQSISA